jgi:hypothetical protein
VTVLVMALIVWWIVLMDRAARRRALPPPRRAARPCPGPRYGDECWLCGQRHELRRPQPVRYAAPPRAPQPRRLPPPARPKFSPADLLWIILAGPRYWRAARMICRRVAAAGTVPAPPRPPARAGTLTAVARQSPATALTGTGTLTARRLAEVRRGIIRDAGLATCLSCGVIHDPETRTVTVSPGLPGLTVTIGPGLCRDCGDEIIAGMRRRFP